MIASLKGYGRIARTVLTVLAGLLVLGIVGSLWMGGRAKHNAESSVIDQATKISDNSLALAFTPEDLRGPVSSARAVQLSDQVRAIVLDPSEFTDVTLLSGEGKVLYSTKLSLIGTDRPGEKGRIQEALKGTAQTTDIDGVYAVMVPLKLRSEVGEPAVVVLERPDALIVSAPGPWRTNAMFLFALLVLLGVAVFGVARLLSVVTSTDEKAVAVPRPQPVVQPAPVLRGALPGLREEGEARRRAEERARSAEERLSLLQEQYRKALDDLQTFQRSTQAVRVTDPRMEERALRAEGQVATLQQQIQTLAAERERLSTHIQELTALGADGDPLADARARRAEEEVETLRAQLHDAADGLARATRELEATSREAEDLREQLGSNNGVSTREFDVAHAELARTRDELVVEHSHFQEAQRELDDARNELRALRNEEARATMLEDELRSTKAELESLRASHRADLVEREAEFEEKVRVTREEFQRQLASIEESYKGQIGQRESDLAGRISQAESDARTAQRELETTVMSMEAARAEAESREQRLIQAAGEITELKGKVAELEAEMGERTVAIGQARKEADELRRSIVGLQADLQRGDEAVSTMQSEVEIGRTRAREVEEAHAAVTKERAALTERVDKLARMLEAAAAENAELNRRLQDFEARRQLELADDEGRAHLDELLQVTQDRLAGQTEKLITAEDRVKELEAELTSTRERAEVAEGELRTHQMSEALREMRTESVEAAAARELTPVAESPLEDRRATTPFLKELSSDAKMNLSRINGIAQLLKHQKGAKEQGQLLKQLATYAKRLDTAVSDLSEADRLVYGTIELQPRRTDLEALVNRVVEESEIGADNEVRVLAESLTLMVDPQRTEQTLNGLLRSSSERTQNGKAILVRLQAGDGGATLSVEDPEPASDAALSPVVKRLAELQGGWAKVEGREGKGAAFRVFLPDLTNGVPAPAPMPAPQAEVEADEVGEMPAEDVPIVVEEPAGPAEPTPEQILARELKRLAEAESQGSRRRKR
jgi:chromosome segregation ATPase